MCQEVGGALERGRHHNGHRGPRAVSGCGILRGRGLGKDGRPGKRIPKTECRNPKGEVPATDPPSRKATEDKCTQIRRRKGCYGGQVGTDIHHRGTERTEGEISMSVRMGKRDTPASVGNYGATRGRAGEETMRAVAASGRDGCLDRNG